MRLPSASKIGLARLCSFAWSPHAPRWPAYDSSPAGEHGTAVHSHAERIANGEQHHDVTPEVAVYTSAIHDALDEMRERWSPTYVHSEVPFAFDAVAGAGRRLEKGAHRDYSSLTTSEIPGTTDLLFGSGGVVAVGDWKTGRGSREVRTRDDWQMLFLGLVVARALDRSEVTIAKIHLEPGDYWIDDHTIDAFDLDNIEDAVRAIYRTVAAGEQTPQPGPHCYGSYCAIRASCPATQATLARVSVDAARHLPVVATLENNEQARRVRVGLKLLKEYAATWQKELDRYALTSPVDMGDGTVYAMRTKQGNETITVTPEARAIIEEVVGPGAIELSTSKTAIEAAAATRATRRGEKAALVRETLDRLRDAGAVGRLKDSTRFEEFKKNDNEDGEAA